MDDRELIEKISRIIGLKKVLDDCALIPVKDTNIVISTDMLHEKTDFPKEMTNWQIGWMCAAASLSDVASSGARPLGIMLAVGIDDHNRFEDIIRGAKDCCMTYGTELSGGDTDRHDELTIVSTGIGMAKHPVLRSGGKSGDLICITGTPGCAQAGLEGHEEHKKALFEPRPMVDEGQALARKGATSMMDVSDGLVLSLYDMHDANPGCGYSIQSDQVPKPSGVSPDEALRMALYGGGDFGLLFTISTLDFPVEGVDATKIGMVTGDQGIFIDGVIVEKKGYLHEWE